MQFLKLFLLEGGGIPPKHVGVNRKLYSQGIKIIQSNISLLLLKYTYIQSLYISVF
jgi:hypothetical protein